MSTKTAKVTAEFGPDGARLWAELTTHYDFSNGVEPLLRELCSTADELARLRSLLAATTDPQLTIRLTGAISKASGAFVRAWKTAGLASPEPPSKGRR